ncbi:MAG TPA: 30S ribosomal protein S17 [Candidatus Aphodousia gallistercoris]|nr:30S ribosomal protein S17 [Candidatus Aphodousia gallistercoris]
MTQENQNTSLTRTLVGKVVSNKMQKTVTVLVERKVKHPLYGKFVLVSKKYHVHSETNDLTEGDTVEIAETRPISKTKSWTVTKVLKKAEII